MAEERKEPWLNYLALSTVILAVCATLSTFKGGGYSTRSVMSQTQASDQWAFFQAKSIKSYIYEMQKDKLELELKALGEKAPQPVVEEYRKKIADYGKKIAKYEGDKADIQKDAKRYEQVRDDAQKHGQAFGIAVIFLQMRFSSPPSPPLSRRSPSGCSAWRWASPVSSASPTVLCSFSDCPLVQY